MADHVLKDAHLTINSVDLSDHIIQMSFPLSAEAVDDTNMGDDSLAFLVGLKNGTFSIRFSQDYAAGEVDASLWAIYDGGAAVAFVIKGNGSATAVTNPKYTGNCILTEDPVVDGTVGQRAEITANFQITGDVARATSD